MKLCFTCTVVRLLSPRQDIKEDQEAVGTILYNEPSNNWSKPDQLLILDGIPYHTVETADIPPAFAEVPVTLDDNGVTFPVCFWVPTWHFDTHTDPLL